MSNNILKDHLKDVADAIRAKKGTTDLINPQDFSKEIASIEGGGSGGGGEWVYYDVRNINEEDKPSIVGMFAQIISAKVVTNYVICPPNTPDVNLTTTLAFGFDKSAPYRNKYMEGINTLGELYAASGGDEIFNEIGITEITKEQFYSLE